MCHKSSISDHQHSSYHHQMLPGAYPSYIGELLIHSIRFGTMFCATGSYLPHFDRYNYVMVIIFVFLHKLLLSKRIHRFMILKIEYPQRFAYQTTRSPTVNLNQVISFRFIFICRIFGVIPICSILGILLYF